MGVGTVNAVFLSKGTGYALCKEDRRRSAWGRDICFMSLSAATRIQAVSLAVRQKGSKEHMRTPQVHPALEGRRWIGINCDDKADQAQCLAGLHRPGLPTHPELLVGGGLFNFLPKGHSLSGKQRADPDAGLLAST